MAGITIKMADAGRIKRANYDFWMKRGAKTRPQSLEGPHGVGPAGHLRHWAGCSSTVSCARRSE